MNKQEQIEKLATALACGNCGQCSWDCPEDKGAECGLKFDMKLIASKLIRAGYGDIKQYQEEIEHLQTELSHREEDLVHATVREFASNIIDLLDEMGMERSSEYNDGYDDGVADCITNIKSQITELYGAEVTGE